MIVHSSIVGRALLRPAVPIARHSAKEESSQSIPSGLCVLTLYQQILADPATQAHQLGRRLSQATSIAHVLSADKRLSLKGKLSRTILQHMHPVPMPPGPAACGRWQRVRRCTD